MSPPTDTPSADRELIDLLHRRGHRVTPQRVMINRLLRSRDTHLTAEDVHASVAAGLPGTSLPTVYATLDLFAELGLVRRVRAGFGPALYDSRGTDHHHLVCRVCGAVRDVDVDLDLSPAKAAVETLGFTAERVDLTVDGVCAGCRGTG